MDEKILLWIKELKRFNPTLHLVGSGMVSTLEQDVEALLSLLRNIHEPEIADIGSGSGLPAIPLKVLHPESHVLLIERSGKKCTFLRHAIDLLDMEGIALIEADPLKSDIGRFDAVMSRSFSPLSTLEKVIYKILKDNGRFYYLFTGDNLPELSPRFRRDYHVSQECREHTLTVARYTLSTNIT
jgi:16S rRNA (guanine527-N7)-methyltransferase